MSRHGVDTDIAELAIGHKRKGLERLYNFDQAWHLRCEAFAKVSDHVGRLLDGAAEEGKVVGIPAAGLRARQPPLPALAAHAGLRKDHILYEPVGFSVFSD